MSARAASRSRKSFPRRQFLKVTAALVLVSAMPARADVELPAIPALAAFLAGRVPRRERLRLEVPRIADNGLSVPLRVAMPASLEPGSQVRRIALFSETNPVPNMALFEFPQPQDRLELDTRIRLAGTQRLVAVAETTDGVLFVAVADVVVTLGGCMDGT